VKAIWSRTIFTALFLIAATAAEASSFPAPAISLTLGKASGPGQVSSAMQVVVLMTVLSLAPAILIMFTSFIRMVVVLSFVRQALGTAQTPPNQVLIGLALFLTLFIMSPVISQIRKDAWDPYMAGSITLESAYDKAAAPLKRFMLKQTREKDLDLFMRASGSGRVSGPEEIPMQVAASSFMVSELKTSFQMGFMIYLPFLVLDLIVASVLMSMGMMMLPPATVSLPFKLMLFVLVDGWSLIVGSLINSFK